MLELGALAGGNIGIGAGIQHRTESFNYSLLDPLDESGMGNAPDSPIVGGQDVDAVFVEGILPVSDSLEVQAAVRYEDYGTVDTTDPSLQFVIRYQTGWVFAEVRSSFPSSIGSSDECFKSVINY